jgi:RecQ family ATP-dependent DNA helicase
MNAPEERLLPLLRERFGHEAFRAHQEDACVALARGEDVLLVMPTGAGKSLVYQLPGLAREGVTLVVSPLLALIEDQVQKLASLGLRAERIHSGRTREESRAVCRRYLESDLDYLFIAPERLAVPGFPEFLAKRPLSLLAIDEAHCISFWGHDFRPEYRMLGRRIEDLRSAGGVVAPVAALTATATPEVQGDIVGQLRLRSPRMCVHGFRRENLHVEARSVPKNLRADELRSIFEDGGRLPAIVYANSRKDTEALADALAGRVHAAAYHAGLSKGRREDVQSAFQKGRLDVVVATVAFGMGIDKANVRTVVHAGMPANLEGYYQEIGRAGRDGLPARAILMHSFADRKTHEFLLEKSYPEPPVLDGVFGHLQRAGRPLPHDELADRARLDEEEFGRALEQLWVHGGARFDERGDVVPGSDAYRLTYARQRRHRFAQLDAMSRYADGARCRMATLVAHFGDAADAERPCEQCDVCRGGVKRTFVVHDGTSRSRVRAPRENREKRPLGGEGESALHRALRAWRMQMAKTDKVPAFCVLTNRTLDSIVTNRPRSHAALYACSGVGSKLLEKYGDAILAIVERAG